MSEKVRAVLGQRLHAVSRDVYDIFSLLERVDEGNIRANLPRKLEAREVELEAIDPGRLLERKDEFRADWQRNLAHLLPPGAEEEFEDVWDPVAEYVGRMAMGLGDMRVSE